MRNWLIWFWSLRISMISHVQSEDLGKLKYNSVWVFSPRTGGADGINPNTRAREDEMRCPSSSIKVMWWGKCNSLILPSSTFYVLVRPSSDWMMPIHIDRAMTLVTLPIQMLISFKSSASDIRGIICNLAPQTSQVDQFKSCQLTQAWYKSHRV